MNNTITIELCKEDRQRLDEVIAFLGLIAGELKSRAPRSVSLTNDGVVVNYGTPETQAAETPEQPDPVNEHPVDDLPWETPEPAAEPEKPKYTKADVLAKVQKLAQPNSPHRVEAKAIVKSYAAKVSDIPEDKYAEVMEKLTALEG